MVNLTAVGIFFCNPPFPALLIDMLQVFMHMLLALTKTHNSNCTLMTPEVVFIFKLHWWWRGDDTLPRSWGQGKVVRGINWRSQGQWDWRFFPQIGQNWCPRRNGDVQNIAILPNIPCFHLTVAFQLTNMQNFLHAILYELGVESQASASLSKQIEKIATLKWQVSEIVTRVSDADHRWKVGWIILDRVLERPRAGFRVTCEAISNVQCSPGKSTSNSLKEELLAQN